MDIRIDAVARDRGFDGIVSLLTVENIGQV
jgi:hypothetical protein